MYVSGHGYGHLMRTAAFLERLCARIDCTLDVCTAAPESSWPAALRRSTRSWRARACDPGVVQPHQLSVDLSATAAALAAWSAAYPARIEEESTLLARGTAAVLGDVPPIAFAAAHRAGVPSFALANFSWDWVYERMGFDRAAADAALAYAHATLLLELEPAAPMPAFRRRCDTGVLGRRAAKARRAVRAQLGVAAHERLVLVAFRERASCELPPPSLDVRYVRCGVAPERRPDVVGGTAGLDFHDLLGAADAVVAKAGYGTIGDAYTASTPLLYTLREGFPEDEVLDAWLRKRPWARRADAAGLAAGAWLGDLEELLCAERPEPPPDDGIEAAVAEVARVLSGRSP